FVLQPPGERDPEPLHELKRTHRTARRESKHNRCGGSCACLQGQSVVGKQGFGGRGIVHRLRDKEATARVLLGEHALVFVLFHDVTLRYRNSTGDQVWSSTREVVRLGKRQSRAARSTAWCANEDAEASFGR